MRGVNIADKLLTVYDGCKEKRTPDQCRQYVIDATPRLVRAYLTAYDVCQKGFSTERCRRLFAPPRDRTARSGLLTGVIIGFIIGKLL